MYFAKVPPHKNPAELFSFFVFYFRRFASVSFNVLKSRNASIHFKGSGQLIGRFIILLIVLEQFLLMTKAIEARFNWFQPA